VGNFCPLRSGSGSTDLIESGSNQSGSETLYWSQASRSSWPNRIQSNSTNADQGSERVMKDDETWTDILVWRKPAAKKHLTLKFILPPQ
jgi:hypothetical protein